jgi:hypothetical protein
VDGSKLDRVCGSGIRDLRAASVAGDMDRVVRASDGRHIDDPARSSTMRRFHSRDRRAVDPRWRWCRGQLAAGIHGVTQSDDPDRLYIAATAAAFSGDLHSLLGISGGVALPEAGALRTLAQALAALAITQLDVSPRQAEASADEELRAARETIRPPARPFTLSTLTWVAVRGVCCSENTSAAFDSAAPPAAPPAGTGVLRTI